MEERSCSTCVFEGCDNGATVCQFCLRGGHEAANWKAKTPVPKPGQVIQVSDTQTIAQVFPDDGDGSTASYYDFPEGTGGVQDLISYLNCNAQMGEILRAVVRYGRCPHSSKKRDLRKINFLVQAELNRLAKYGD